MSGSVRGRLAVTAAAAVILSGTPMGAAVPDTIGTAQAIVGAFFPELLSPRHRMLIFRGEPFDRPFATSDFVVSFGLEVEPAVRDFLKDETTEVGTGLLTAACEFFPDGQLRSMRLMGRANHYRDYRRLEAMVDDHPEWSDAEVVDLLKQEEARYGPDNRAEVIKHLPDLTLLDRPLGGPVTLGDVSFVLRTKDSQGNLRAQLEWIVTLDIPHVRGAGAQAFRYTLGLEPSTGTLIEIHADR